MTDDKDKKDVHILVPKGFQNRELLRAEKGISHDATDTPAQGQCIKCRDTGAVFHRLTLEDPRVVDGKIVSCTPKMHWFRCKCYRGQFWRNWHPLNVRARAMPKWEKEIREALEAEKALIIRESGGSYEPGADTFLNDIGYKPEKKQGILSVDEIVKATMRKKGDIE